MQGRMLLVCESLAASLHMASICPYIIGNFLFLITKDTLQSPAELQHFVPLSLSFQVREEVVQLC